MDNPITIEQRLERIEVLLTGLVEREATKEWYTTEEFARVLGKADFTVREWCRLERINATKRGSGRGPHAAWVISHEELLRYRQKGLIPRPPAK